jgi:diguanylate cyclase (GGDEF)-like protein/PAS domain S-box-containing protein
MNSELTSSRKLTRHIVLLYLAFGSLWLLVSDFVLVQTVKNQVLLTELQILKGWLFIGVTGGLLYQLIQRSYRGIDQTQHQLLASQKELKGLFAAMDELIFILDQQGRYQKVIATRQKGLYKPIDDLSNKTFYEIFELKKAQFFHQSVLQALKTQQTQQITYTLIIEQQKFEFEANISPLSSEQVIWVARDITVQQQAKEELQASEKRYRSLFECHPLPMAVYDVETREFLAVNQAAIALYGYSKAELLKMQVQHIHAPEEIPRLVQTIANLTEEYYLSGLWKHRKKDGTIIEAEVSGHPLPFGGRRGRLVEARDITQQRQAEAEAKQKDQLYRTLAQNFPNGAVVLFDLDLRYTLAEGFELKKLGLTKADIEGKTLQEVFPSVCERIKPLYLQALAGEVAIAEIPYAQQIYQTHTVPLVNEAGVVFGGMMMVYNVTQQKQVEAKLVHYAFRDPLTNLPNKTHLLKRLEELIEEDNDDFAVIVLDLGNFSKVKYSLGHQLAEKLLVMTAKRVQESLGALEEVARVGDQSLGVILHHCQDAESAQQIARQIQQHIHTPIRLHEHEIFSPVKVGIACHTAAWQLVRPEDWLHAADTAMHHSKSKDYFHCVLFHPSMHQEAIARLCIETKLRNAISLQQLRVYYQPIIHLQTGRIAGFEALVRWQHPEKGLIAPGEFLSVAQEAGLITQIDWWVIQEACQQLKRWQEQWQQADKLTVSINLSEQLLFQLGFLEKIERILTTSGICGDNLKLEVVESVVMEDNQMATSMLKYIRNLGIQLSIDDFGTGYSCLERLHQLPIDTLKIDRSFINKFLEDLGSLEIVRTIITLAHSLNLGVIAEGIETNVQAEKLKSLQCEYGQGYLFSLPVSQVEATKLLKRQFTP